MTAGTLSVRVCQGCERVTCPGDPKDDGMTVDQGQGSVRVGMNVTTHCVEHV